MLMMCLSFLPHRIVRSWVSHALVFAPIDNVWRRLMNMLMSLENIQDTKILAVYTIEKIRPRTIFGNLKPTAEILVSSTFEHIHG